MNEILFLLVDDDPDDITLTLHLLRECNVANRIEVLRDGAEALEFVQTREAYQRMVILLELRLPKVSGVDVIARIKSDENTRAIPIIPLVSSPDEPYLQSCQELGVSTYLLKPLSFESVNRSFAQLGLHWLLVNRHPQPT